jgi:hypothetical protein
MVIDHPIYEQDEDILKTCVTKARIGATERAIERNRSKCHVSTDYHMAMTSLVWDILGRSTIRISDVTMTSSEQSGAVWSRVMSL